MIERLGQENTKVASKHVNQIVELLRKEDKVMQERKERKLRQKLKENELKIQRQMDILRSNGLETATRDTQTGDKDANAK